MSYFTLDFNEIKTVLELHQYLKEVFGLPDYYGNNMDALWDCLACRYDGSTTIELRNLDTLKKRLEKTAYTMLAVFQDLHEEDGVVIRIVEEEKACAEKSIEISSDDLSGYLI